ncbi:hypothetical protein V1264_014703 [Littorina saxatilis]|uniref:Uncharacterized protein n=1 Tax=Littorina saxatilis TaxID=31220 RepID=A0AAN9BTK0_9CAEN
MCLRTLQTTKTLPAKEVQTQHMIERYLAGNSELLEPCVPGTLIYKDMMKERARIRSNVRRRSQNGVSSVLRDSRRKINRRKPRSRREIVDSLKEMIEAELVEASAEGPQGKNHNANASGPRGRKPAPPVNSNNTQKKPSMTRSGGGVGGVPGRSFVTDLGQDNGPRRTSLNNSDGNLTPRRLSLTQNDGNNTPRKLSLTLREGGSTTPHMPSLTQKDLPGNAPARKSSLTNKDTSSKDPAVKKRVTLPPIEGDSKAPASKNTPRSRSDSKVDISLPQILEEREETMVTKEMSDLSSAGGSAQNRYVKREVRASSDGPTPPGGSAKRLPPLAKVEVRRPEHVPSRSWNAALRFVNDRMHDRFTEQLLSAGSPSQQDYETSEGSLQLLESRIKQFHVKHGESSPVRLNLKLPKLRRYKLDLEDEEQHLPKPGGKVWIRKRMCQIANSKFKVKGHEHIRYHMVPELPEFDKVKKMQTAMQQLMDNSVLKKQGKEAGEQGEGKTPNPHPPSLPNLNEHRASFVGDY